MRFTGSVGLRPVRLGFVLPPDDLALVSRVARLNACIWGGRFNPMIPFSDVAGDRWLFRRGIATGAEVARGFIDFFEPDVLVEAQPGMAAAIAWGDESRGFGLPRVVTLDRLFQPNSRGELELKAGIDAVEPMFHLYDLGYKYTRRYPQPFVTVDAANGDAYFDVVGGRYPEGEAFDYFRQNYEDIFSPVAAGATAETALNILRDGHAGPLFVTRHQLEETSSHGRLHTDTIFIFDASNPGDLIDYWNLRLVDRRVTPINVAWLDAQSAFVRELIVAAHRPIPANPYGTMFHANVVFAASISEERRSALIARHLADLPSGALVIGYRPDLWSNRGYGKQRRETKITVRAATKSFDEPVTEDQWVRVPALTPEFANTSRRFSEGRWINVIMPSNFVQQDDLARVYPTSLWAPGFPNIGVGQDVRIAREGWVLEDRYDIGTTGLRLQTGREAFIAWLKRNGIVARPSEEGQVAAQVISAASGLFASAMFCSKRTVQLLNEMAEGHVELGRDGKKVLATIPTRTKHINTIRQHFAEREKQGFGFWNRLDHFLKQRVFRAGLRVPCPICTHQNWFDLDSIGYKLTCTRCLKTFRFSEEPEKLGEVEWYYRITGPFAAPDYARGAYAVALTLRCLSPQHHAELTWSTGLVLETLKCEVDFMAWFRPERMRDEERDEPVLLIGEAKSFGTNALDEGSINGLKKVAEQFPGAIMVVSSLRDIAAFSSTEIERLRDLARWGRRGLKDGQPINPLIVLTGSELFAELGLEQAWRRKGEADALHAAYDLADPYTISEISLERYLNMPSYWDEEAARRDPRYHRHRLITLISSRAVQLAQEISADNEA